MRILPATTRLLLRFGAALSLCVLAGCAAAQPVRPPEPQAPPPPSPSSTALAVDGELAHDDATLALPGEGAQRRADTYQATWAREGTVRVFLEGALAGELDLLARGRVAAPPLELTVQAGRAVELAVVGRSATVEGAYRLLFDPPPDDLVAPPRNTPEGRRTRALALPPQPGFYGTQASWQKKLSVELAGFTRDGAAIPVPLEQFAGMETPGVPERCYKLVVRLQDSAAWSDLARRALRAEVRFPESLPQSGPAFVAMGPTLVLREACPDRTGAIAFEVGTLVEGAEHDLGKGPAAVEVWARPNGPLARAEADLRGEIARSTRGYAAQRALPLKLEAPAPLEVELPRGRCVAAVLRLDKGARFSAEIRRARAILAELSPANLTRQGGPGAMGPGAVHLLGCAREAGKATLRYQQGRPLGSGGATLQLYFRTATAAELKK